MDSVKHQQNRRYTQKVLIDSSTDMPQDSVLHQIISTKENFLLQSIIELNEFTLYILSTLFNHTPDGNLNNN